MGNEHLVEAIIQDHTLEVVMEAMKLVMDAMSQDHVAEERCTRGYETLACTEGDETHVCNNTQACSWRLR